MILAGGKYGNVYANLFVLIIIVLLSHHAWFCKQTGENPEHWSNSDLQPLPKSRDLITTENYKANKMLLNGIRPRLTNIYGQIRMDFIPDGQH